MGLETTPVTDNIGLWATLCGDDCQVLENCNRGVAVPHLDVTVDLHRPYGARQCACTMHYMCAPLPLLCALSACVTLNFGFPHYYNHCCVPLCCFYAHFLCHINHCNNCPLDIVLSVLMVTIISWLQSCCICEIYACPNNVPSCPTTLHHEGQSLSKYFYLVIPIAMSQS